MKTRFFYTKSVIGLVGLCLTNPLFALPTVESRTGEPVLRSSGPRNSAQPQARYSITAEDRAAQLTLTQIEALQKEISELRGTIELQEHEMNQLKKSQQDFYIDLDRRLNVLQLSQPRPANGVSNTPKSQKSTTPAPAAAIMPVIPSPTKSISMGTAEAPKSNKTNPTEAATTATLPIATMAPPSKSAVVAQKLTPKVSSSTGSLSEQEAYEAAYGFVRTKRYPEAVAAFQEYLNRFPNGEYAAHAHYWLGEVYMAQWQTDKTKVSFLDKAGTEFSSITTQFPNHPKAVDATLKLGLIEFDKGNEAAAIQHLTEVKTRFPGTAAARIADTRLQRVPE
jgi:tol-pal system protein YbgF